MAQCQDHKAPSRYEIDLRSDVGIRLMLELAKAQSQAENLTAIELADRCGFSLSFVEQVLARLRIGRLVRSRRGRSGGYSLARPAGQIAVGEVLRIIDGSLAPAPCAWPQAVTCSWCEPGPPCSLAPLWTEASRAIDGILDVRTLHDLVGMPASTEEPPAAASF